MKRITRGRGTGIAASLAVLTPDEIAGGELRHALLLRPERRLVAELEGALAHATLAQVGLTEAALYGRLHVCC